MYSSDPTPSHSPNASCSPPTLATAAAANGSSNTMMMMHDDFGRLPKGTDNEASGKHQCDRKDSIWSDIATACLLEAFEEKWIALRRGNLRCSNWEEVAGEVNLRCGVSRTGEQCRHKMEKLRRKYREEKSLRDRLCFGPSKWIWYDKFEGMLGDNKPKECELLACNEIARKTAAADALDRFATWNGVEGMPLGLRSQYNMDTEVRVNVNAADSAPAAKNERDDASFTSPSQRAPRGIGTENHGVATTKVNLAAKAIAKRRKANSFLPALKCFMDGILRIEQHKMELQKDNERLRCEMELKRTELLVGLELKRTQMQLQMVKAVTRAKVKKATSNVSASTTRGHF
ncbi:hypothetical protein O6H91_06G055300 [Diphasiastrum complanatum]|uniref:Uncharacterized protein n=3 Tax=Diphasiastrum complanatum TaxID=34168 RepID=A0ACC2DE37_DIPCM|nr:hypothetical protein O6H91_06G055300 [Diphasiastrum complanatum]KAJ7552443.1 hypothetical protein O6H91_06G055300 [Diphasiastrum complanatum]KAJ7552444.1 hypothetical protein O6H91_06G055300 [Diphasiastrum complanatum]